MIDLMSIAGTFTVTVTIFSLLNWTTISV